MDVELLKKEKRKIFLDTLSNTGQVEEAARAAGYPYNKKDKKGK